MLKFPSEEFSYLLAVVCVILCVLNLFTQNYDLAIFMSLCGLLNVYVARRQHTMHELLKKK